MKTKKGTIKKHDTELMLVSGSKITIVDSNGEVIEYILASDTSVILNHDARLFPIK